MRVKFGKFGKFKYIIKILTMPATKKQKMPNLKKYNKKKFRDLEKEVMEMAKDPYRLNEFGRF